MAEGGRPWWKLSAIEKSTSSPKPRSSLGEFSECISARVPITPPPKVPVTPLPKVLSTPPKPVVKIEHTDHRPSFPIFSPGTSYPAHSPSGKTVDCSRIKAEPLANIKSEPLAYIEQALVKGEFPYDFSWPVMKWEPSDGVPNTDTASIKGDSKHYFPTPKDSVFKRLGMRRSRDRNRPPPNWQYIYSRQTYEPTESARAWWNGDVERALIKRREAYLVTKLKDNVPIETRMERLWSFEVAKDEARRIIAESKWKTALGPGGFNGVNVGASCSSQENTTENNSFSTNSSRPLSERLGQLVTIGEDTSVKKNFESPRKDRLSSVSTDEVEILPVDKENIEVLTIDDEIEEGFSSDEDDIKIVGENDSDVIFIQKKQGEVTMIAQVQGRVVKMNRKRKLCVTVHNSAKRQCASTVDSEQSSTADTEKQDGDISLIDESIADDGVSSSLQDKSAVSDARLSDSEKTLHGSSLQDRLAVLDARLSDAEKDSHDEIVEMEVDNNKEVLDDNEDVRVDNSTSSEGENNSKDAVANIVDDGSKDVADISEISDYEKDPHDNLVEMEVDDDKEVFDGNQDVQVNNNMNCEGNNSKDSVANIVEDVENVSKDEGEISEVSLDESLCISLNASEGQPDDEETVTNQDEMDVDTVEYGYIRKYAAAVSSVPPATDIIVDKEEDDVLVDDSSEDEVLVVESDIQLEERTLLMKEADDITILESSSDDESCIQEAAIYNKDCDETRANIECHDVDDEKSNAGASKEIEIVTEKDNVSEKVHVSSVDRDEKSETEESEEIEIITERASVREKVRVSCDDRDEKNESGLSEETKEIDIESEKDITQENACVSGKDLLSKSPVMFEVGRCAETHKNQQSADDDAGIEILETDDTVEVENGGNSSFLHRDETGNKVQTRRSRRSAVAVQSSFIVSQEPEESKFTPMPLGRSANDDLPKTRRSKRELLEADNKAQSPSYSVRTRSKRK